ncbi:MAG: response regulator [Methanosarcinales archaeon]|nr:response regulator [Methanosarcinales archaeon]
MKNILVVEDNPLNMELVSDLLESYGYQVTGAMDGEEALEIVNGSTFDLILLDMQLPKMDGLEVLENLKSNPATANITVVALTAHAMKGDEVKYKEAGCSGYIPKPVEVHKLKSSIEQYVGE